MSQNSWVLMQSPMGVAHTVQMVNYCELVLELGS